MTLAVEHSAPAGGAEAGGDRQILEFIFNNHANAAWALATLAVEHSELPEAQELAKTGNVAPRRSFSDVHDPPVRKALSPTMSP